MKTFGEQWLLCKNSRCLEVRVECEHLKRRKNFSVFIELRYLDKLT